MVSKPIRFCARVQFMVEKPICCEMQKSSSICGIENAWAEQPTRLSNDNCCSWSVEADEWECVPWCCYWESVPWCNMLKCANRSWATSVAMEHDSSLFTWIIDISILTIDQYIIVWLLRLVSSDIVHCETYIHWWSISWMISIATAYWFVWFDWLSWLSSPDTVGRSEIVAKH